MLKSPCNVKTKCVHSTCLSTVLIFLFPVETSVRVTLVRARVLGHPNKHLEHFLEDSTYDTPVYHGGL